MTTTDDMIKELENKMTERSDVNLAIEQIFLDTIDKEDKLHKIDLRSRLTSKAVRGHSVINFLESVKLEELNLKNSFCDGLDALSISLKRHVVSHKGLSREEIIKLFTTNNELNKQSVTNNSWITPQK